MTWVFSALIAAAISVALYTLGWLSEKRERVFHRVLYLLYAGLVTAMVHMLLFESIRR